jgi:SAM-dependent methyltransferase
VQKRIDEVWRREAQAVYAGYALYHQSASRDEQKAFELDSGFGQPRSTVILEKLAEEIGISEGGRMLDLGCGVGVTLRAFHALAPHWQIEGFDPHLKDADGLLKLPGVAAIYGGALEELPTGYRCIACFHVLEHIVEPFDTLRTVRTLLADDGVFVVQVPYYRDNPFDLAIADHCSHFTPQSISALFARAGLEVVSCSTSVVPREMTVVARRGEAHFAKGGDPATECDSVRRAEAWLTGVLNDAAAAAKHRPFGIFGTSIAGTIVASTLAGRTDFFVDEDASRVGSSHLGKPILAPADIPEEAHVMLALVPTIAMMVARRVQAPGRTLYVPPDFPN